ncbi:enhanced serine sensitivity protein SseB C-terminal domain-containing protein [uncultured Hymenobacter sp.]|uniref:enhanced serine sensitivity protein SseB C-terminal domain-containing protein n=1 Tax=uncultured Hymenobacter sp. TaxID=170016 RepID=UPI0035C9EE6A
MGLFDFLKSKPEPAAPTPPAAPNATPDAPTAPGSTTSTTSTTGGPRYQGAKFTAPPAAVPAPRLPEPPPLPFQPTNVLEQLLLLASTDENARPAFYQALLQEEILMVLAPGDTLAPGEVVLNEGQEIQLQVLSDGKLPIFSSAARLHDGNMAEAAAVSFVRVPGAAFFNMVQGQDCVLNPFSPAGKLLPKEEVAALLAGQLSGGGLAPDGDPSAETQVQLTQPEAYPPGLTESLQAHCAGNPVIGAAYLAEMTVAEAPTAPRLLLAFDTTTPDPAFLQQLGPVLDGKTGQYQFVDLMLLDVNSDEGVNPYFRTIEPVYRRA